MTNNLVIMGSHPGMNLIPCPFSCQEKGDFLRGLARTARQTSGGDPRPGMEALGFIEDIGVETVLPGVLVAQGRPLFVFSVKISGNNGA